MVLFEGVQSAWCYWSGVMQNDVFHLQNVRRGRGVSSNSKILIGLWLNGGP